jgi:hypothetical protein
MKRIEELNEAYLSIRNALKVIKFQVKSNDGETHFWKIEKALGELHKLILKDLRDEIVDEEFDKIVKKFKR